MLQAWLSCSEFIGNPESANNCSGITNMDLQDIIDTITKIGAIFGILSSIWLVVSGIRRFPQEQRKAHADEDKVKAEIIAGYEETITSMQARLKAVEDRTAILRGEVDKQTALAAEYKAAAEKADQASRQMQAQNARLQERINGLEAILTEIREWAKRWGSKLAEAGIDPLPLE